MYSFPIFKDGYSLSIHFTESGRVCSCIQIDIYLELCLNPTLSTIFIIRILDNGLMLVLKLQADIDNSGTIDYGEFIAATLHLNKVEREDHLFAAFSYFDKDGSGYITQDELQQACEEFGIEDAHLEEIIREVDQDNVSIFLTIT